MEKLALFASGSGSNAERIADYFKPSKKIGVEIILTNNPAAFVLKRAEKLNIPSFIFSRDDLYQSDKVLKILAEHEISWIILAGFLWLIPQNLLRAYSGRILNIHPALLPKHGGKGFYGMKVHEAVIAANEKESGITIHTVDERYDEGQILFQAKCSVSPEETPDSLATKIHELEYRYYPEVIERVCLNF